MAAANVQASSARPPSLVSATSDDSGSSVVASPDFQVVLLDLNPVAWQEYAVAGTSDQPQQRADAVFAQVRQVLASVIVYLNAHTALQHGNGLAVYGVVNGNANLLYTTAPFARAAQHAADASTMSMCLPFKQVDDAVFLGARAMMDDAATRPEPEKPIGMVHALSLALCHIHRLCIATQASQDTEPQADGERTGPRQLAANAYRFRILVLSVTPDASAQYVPMMNAIFSAQKQDVNIDVCKLFGGDTVFLRQACYLTGGHYYRLEHTAGLLEVLMAVYLPSRIVRPLLMYPAMDDVDFRAACFCHRRNIDIGYHILRAARAVHDMPRQIPHVDAAVLRR
ncbi:Tfb4p [Malassezia vespertilionis]|uniref:General transcription and DNA repair factor IIH subunit TFB4 n=1 Tax=Malassezia vespertilionis TaxID=2020962 RepID=A0A2N1JE21_9BASI|nr:Tfb4p [Malassezia vespertilionis]